MYTYFSRFLHHTLSHSDVKPQSTSMLSPSGLTRWSRSNQVANLPHLDTPIKSECDSYCAGRSMVEMLGVLAIIGVLSVGAISGYSKAMFKYKLNKQAEQYNTLINAVARNAHSFDNINTGGFQNITAYFIKMGEIPQEMLKNNSSNYVYDIFHQEYIIALINDTTNGDKSINLSVIADASLKTKSAESLEICRNMLITAKENADSISSVSSVTRNDENTGYNSTVFWGDKNCANGWSPCLKNLTLDNIYNFCTKYIGKDYNEFKISWT